MGRIGSNGLEGLFRKRKAHGGCIFSVGNADFFLGKCNVIQRYAADFLGSETHGVRQINHGIAPDIPGMLPLETGEESLDFF